ncbi:MAG: ArgE/DapE family deacylase [Chloroflexi bacterium]|nr:ArgE/DapE family deacylase [Chloroflexota bacterium]
MVTQRLQTTVGQLCTAIEAREDELVALVADLVRRPSRLGEEAAAQTYVADHLRGSGLAVDVWDLDEAVRDLPEAGDSGVPFAGRPNVAGVLKGTGGGRSLILNGHIDVVSPEPLAAWTHDPWAAEIVGHQLFGRGALDMKSGIALNLFLARLLRDLGIRLAGDLTVESVVEEECTGNGTLDACRRYRADAAVLTEPGGGFFTMAHVGVLWFRVAITGKAAHAARAPQGVNAIVKTVPIIRALEELDRRLNETVHPLFQGIDHPINLNIGVIRGGDWPSTVPGACELHCRLSFYPGRSVGQARAEIEDAVRRAAEQDEWLRSHPPVVTYDGFRSGGSEVSMEEPSVQMLGAWHRRVTGEALQPRVGTGTNDMRYFNFAGIPAGCYGAAGGNMHAADEWLDLRSLVPTAKVLGGFVLEWCGGDLA